jgi:hypothetical protein
MLTGVTAAATQNTRVIKVDQSARPSAEVALLFFRRLKDQAIYEAKRTRDGLPTKCALLERSWVEQFTQPGWPGWKTSFANCCLMLGEDVNEERAKALKEIDRTWRKALVDWGRRKWQYQLEQIENMVAGDNPALTAHRGVQGELPLDGGRS